MQNHHRDVLEQNHVGSLCNNISLLAKPSQGRLVTESCWKFMRPYFTTRKTITGMSCNGIIYKVSVSIYCIVSSHLLVLLRKILAPRCSCIQTKTCLSTVIILTNVNQIQNYICLFGLGKTEAENLVTHFHLKKVLFLNIIIWQAENKLYL